MLVLPGMADTLRLAFWNAEMNRAGPGLLLRDVLRGGDPQVASVVQTIATLDADVLVLGGVDYDAGNAALSALNDLLPAPYTHVTALRPNTGIPSGFDLDGNGRADEARDAIGYGRFPGEGGMAVLSRLPFVADQSRDFSGLLWADLPGADLPALPDGAAGVLRLSTTGHHETAVALPDGRALHLLTWHASTPAFDGPEDRNGRRNHDETAFWTLLLDEALPFAPHKVPFVLIGQANADPDKGDGNPAAISALLADPRLQATGGGDTVDYGPGIGPLRVAYILPDASLTVTGSGEGNRTDASRHLPIWVQIAF